MRVARGYKVAGIIHMVSYNGNSPILPVGSSSSCGVSEAVNKQKEEGSRIGKGKGHDSVTAAGCRFITDTMKSFCAGVCEREFEIEMRVRVCVVCANGMVWWDQTPAACPPPRMVRRVGRSSSSSPWQLGRIFVQLLHEPKIGLCRSPPRLDILNRLCR